LNQLLSSGTHLIARGVLFVLPPITVAMLRFLAASLVFLGWFGIRRSRARIERRDWASFLLLGFLAVTVNQGCFLFGLARSTASHAALLYALTPLVVLLLARGLLHEERFGQKLVGTLVAFLGVALILLERGLKNEAEVLKGDLLILVAVVAWSGYTILSKRLLRRYDAMTVTGWAIVAGTALSLPALLVPGAIPRLQSISLASWGGILYLAVATSVIAYPLWNYALRYMEASKVAIATNLQPILTAVASRLLFGEQFTSGFVIGAILILAGVTWVQTRGSRTERAAAVPVEAG
jgi:drug/metabolite transporter (DMT)-like permease